MMGGLEAVGMDVSSQMSLGSPMSLQDHQWVLGTDWWSELLLLFQGKDGACLDRFGGADSVSGCGARAPHQQVADGMLCLCPGETCPSTSTLTVQSAALNAADWADACCLLLDELSFVIFYNRTCQHSS